MSEEMKQILEQFISTPKESQIQVDFDLNKKIFILTVPIYSSPKSLPSVVKEYVQKRAGRTFKPHATSFHLEGEQEVILVQEIPFRWSLDGSSRQDIIDFLRLAKRCHRMLYEIALEEKYKEAMDLLD